MSSKNIDFSSGGQSESDKSVNIIYFMTNENCHRLLLNDTKCFETNTHAKFKLKLFKRRMILQDSEDKVYDFSRCQDFIPQTLSIKNSSPVTSNIFLTLLDVYLFFKVPFYQ